MYFYAGYIVKVGEGFGEEVFWTLEDGFPGVEGGFIAGDGAEDVGGEAVGGDDGGYLREGAVGGGLGFGPGFYEEYSREGGDVGLFAFFEFIFIEIRYLQIGSEVGGVPCAGMAYYLVRS